MKTWRVARFDEIFERVDRKFLIDDSEHYKCVGVRWYGMGAFVRERLLGAEISRKQQWKLRAGDIIYNKLFAWKGAFAIAGESLDGCIVSDKFPTYHADPEQVDEQWIRHYFRTPKVAQQAAALSKGAAAISKLTLNPPQFWDLTIPLPSLPEQRRIVGRIEELAVKINEASELREKAGEEAEALTKAHLNRLFGNYYENIAGNLTASRWVRLDEVVTDVADGPHITPAYVEDGVPFITALNITSGRIRFGNHKYVTPDDHELFKKRAQAEVGDVLISKDGTIGFPCFVDTDRPFSFFVSVALVKPKRGVLDGEFLTWVIRAPYLQKQIQKRSRGDMIRHLVLREIRDLTIPLPPAVEQSRVVAELDALQGQVDMLKKLQADTAAELDALLPSVLDKAFKGQL